MIISNFRSEIIIMSTDFIQLPKLYGKVLQIQIEQFKQDSTLVFSVQSESVNKPHYFVNSFDGDPITRAQLDLLRDALINNKTVRIAYEETDKNQALKMIAVRIHFE